MFTRPGVSRGQLFLLCVLCAAFACPKAVCGLSQGSGPVSTSPAVLFLAAQLTASSSGGPLGETANINSTVSPLIVVGLIVLGVVAAVISVRMICGSNATEAPRTSLPNEAPDAERSVASHYT